jgi:hypothetical protein
MGYLITHRSVGRPVEPMGTLSAATIPRKAKRNLEKVRLVLSDLKTWMNTEHDEKTRSKIAQAGLALNDLLIAHDLEN